MKIPVFKLFWLLLCVLILEGCGGGRQGVLSYEIGDAGVTITDCEGSAEGELVIPNEIEGSPVTSIGDNAFWGCGGLTSITIPDSVTSIGEVAFWNCSSLTSIIIPETVTRIGGMAFCRCYSLTSITLPDSVTSIGWGAFGDCRNLTSINIPEGVTSIGEWAFFRC
jgi:hypothetical protein